MKKICNLSYDDFSSYDSFSEMLPKYTKNLVGYFPYDESITNVIPEINISSENNTFKTYGMISQQIPSSKNIKHVNNKLVFDGTSYLYVNKKTLTNIKDFAVNIKFKITSSDNNSALFSFGDKNNIFTVMYYHEFDSLVLNIKTIDDPDNNLRFNNEKNTLLLTNIGDIQINKAYDFKIVLNNDILSCFVNDDLVSTNILMLSLNSDKIIIGQKLLDDTASESYNTTTGFKGEIEYIKINNYSYINKSNPISLFGLSGNSKYTYDSKNLKVVCKKCANVNKLELDAVSSYKLTSDLIYKNESSKKSDFVYYEDNYVFTLSEKDYLKASNYYNISFLYKNNTIYEFNFNLNKREFNTNLSVIEENNIVLNSDWTMYSLVIQNKSTADIDMNLNFSIKSNSYISKDTPINLIYSECHITNKNVPAFLSNINTEIRNDNSIIDAKDITSTINHFSIGFEFTPYSITTEGQYPQLFWLGAYTSDHSKDWLGVYRGSGWNNSEILKISVTFSNIQQQIELLTLKQNITGHTIYVGISYNNSEHSFLILIYDKTSKKYLYKNKSINAVYNYVGFDSMLINANGTSSFLKNLSIYNKALSIEEFENNFTDTFQILENGKIITSKIDDNCPRLINNNIYRYKLGEESYNSDNLIKNIDTSSYYSYDNSALVGKYSCNLVIDLINNYATNKKYIETNCNEKLYQDSIEVTGWRVGFAAPNSYDIGYVGGNNKNDGYSSKFVYEGPDNNICLKLIDYNTKYGSPHQLIAATRTIDSSEFSLWQQVASTKKFKVVFKAKTDIKESMLLCGFYKYNKSSARMTTDKLYPVTVDNNWNEYSVEIPVTEVWDLSKEAMLYICMKDNKTESTIWISDILINVSNYDIPIDILKNPQTNKVLNLNINSMMKENESYKTTDEFFIKPWTILYWKKPITPTSTTSYYSLDSFGQYIGNTSNLNYLFLGHNTTAKTLVYYFKGGTRAKTIDDKNYFNNWLLFSIRYDGTGINVKILGENLKFNETIPGVLTTNDFLSKKEHNRDLCLGGWCANNVYTCSCSLYKDLMISSNALKDEEIEEIFKKKFSYKNNNIEAQCNLKEI